MGLACSTSGVRESSPPLDALLPHPTRPPTHSVSVVSTMVGLLGQRCPELREGMLLHDLTLPQKSVRDACIFRFLHPQQAVGLSRERHRASLPLARSLCCKPVAEFTRMHGSSRLSPPPPGRSSGFLKCRQISVLKYFSSVSLFPLSAPYF